MTQERIFTGIGARSTPPDVLAQMTDIARQLVNRGWLLRSGGADGADTAFEKGCDASYGRKEIYLPWYRFNANRSPLCHPTGIAYDTAKVIYGDQWNWLKAPVKKLHARNMQCVAGAEVDKPSVFVLCWTPGGDLIGGTRTGILLAQALGVRVVNLATEGWSWDLAEVL